MLALVYVNKIEIQQKDKKKKRAACGFYKYTSFLTMSSAKSSKANVINCNLLLKANVNECILSGFTNVTYCNFAFYSFSCRESFLA